MGNRGHENEGLDKAKDREFLKGEDSGRIPGLQGGQLFNPMAQVTSRTRYFPKSRLNATLVSTRRIPGFGFLFKAKLF